MKASVTALGILVVSCASRGQLGAIGAVDSDPATIDMRCGRLEKSKLPTVLFLLGSVFHNLWDSFSTEAQLKTAVESGEVSDRAYVWKMDDGILVLWVLTSRPGDRSGDWTHYLNYCFRADGTLARSTSRLNTFNLLDGGPVSIERKRYFDVSGRQVGFSGLIDLTTGKPAPELEDMFRDHDEPQVRRIDSLPFSGLLHSAAQHGVAPLVGERQTVRPTCRVATK
jgi:hypothetical protein